MKQPLIYSALVAFALSAAAPLALANDAHDTSQNEDTRSMDSGTHDAGDYGTDYPRDPADPRHPSNINDSGDDSTDTDTGTGSGLDASETVTPYPEAGAGPGPAVDVGR